MKLTALTPAIMLMTVACASAPAPAASQNLIHGSGPVSVMYAGSLTMLLEKKLGPAFNGATGFSFQGEGKGSLAITNLIKGGVRAPDVFVSADPAVFTSLQGQGNGSYVSWWVAFASTEMVIGWSPRSRFRADFESAKAGTRTWQSVLEEPGLRLGRTDPELDPKGYRTLFLFQLDERRTGNTGEARRILGDSRNPNQVFPEEQLVARMQEGQLDAGVFYRIEAVEAGLPYLPVPPEVNQGDPSRAAQYASATFTNSRGQHIQGAPIVYTVTIPRTVRNQAGAKSFVQFLLGKNGQQMLRTEGLQSLTPVVAGDPGAVPSEIRPLVTSP